MVDYLKSLLTYRSHTRGQTSLEYILLLTVAFITAYIVVTGPLLRPTQYVLATIRSGIQNTVRNGEWKDGEITPTGDNGHPIDARRFEGLHL